MIQERCQMNVESCPVAQLQNLLWCPPASKEQKKILDVFAALFDEEHTSGILLKIWDTVCPPLVSDLSVLAADVWPTFIAEVDRVSADLVTLNITCADAAKLLHSQLANGELELLEQALRRSGKFTPRAFSPCKVQDKLLLFENMIKVHEGAMNVLVLKTNVGFTGDFNAVENIARVSNTMNSVTETGCTISFCTVIFLLQSAEVFSQLPLCSFDVDDSLKKVVDFLMNLCHGNRFSSIKDCLCGLQKSSELVKWLRDDVQGKCT